MVRVIVAPESPPFLEITLDDPSRDPEQWALSREEVVAGFAQRGVEAHCDFIAERRRSAEALKELERARSEGREPDLQLVIPPFQQAVSWGFTGEILVTLAPTIGPVLGTILGAWLQARRGRKVRVKFRGLEVEAQTTEQVETLLDRIKELQQSEPKETTKPKKVILTKTSKKT